MRLILIALMLCLSLPAKAENVVQEIIKTDHIGQLKVSYDVILKRRITKDELEQLARAIKAQHPNTERVFIGYFIAGTAQAAPPRHNGHWGSSHWEGDQVRLVPGPSEADVAKQRAAKGPPVPDGATITGRWFIPGVYGGHVAIYDTDGKTYLYHRWHDGNGSPAEVASRKHKAGTAYREEGTYDYFVVTRAGDLELWDNSGKLDHEKSVKTTE